MFRLFENAVDPFRPADTGTPPDRVWPFLIAEFRPFRRVVALSLLSTVICAVIEVWLIGFAGRLVDQLGSASPETFWRTHGTGLLTAAALILFARPALHFVNEALDDIAFRPNAKVMALWRAHRYVSRQPVGWFRNDLAGRIATWVREGASAAMTCTYVVMHTLAYVFVYVVGSAWLMSTIDARLLLPLGIWLVLYAALGFYIVPRYRRASERLQEANSDLTGLLVDSYANVDTLALLDASTETDRPVFAGTRRTQFRVERLEVTMNAGMMALNSMLMVGLIGYGIVLWHSGNAPLGLVAAGLALAFRINSMAEWLLDAVSALFGSVGVLRRALVTISQPLAVADRPDAGTLTVTQGQITLTDVSHHYGNGSGGLDGISLRIAGGEKVGLVGRSGAGKSTLVNLVLRFFEPEAGKVEIDGQDITSVTQESLRHRIAMVTQEAMLLHRSIRENIAGPSADMALVTQAARQAAADTFVEALRDQEGRTGYDAHVGERGVKLSGGQRQRVALARAIYKDAPILILDEATSALDSEVEAVIHDTLGKVMTGRTVIAIAHRLSTIARMDRIVVLDEGRIVEEGTHAELLARDGLYASLWARQSGGFLGI